MHPAMSANECRDQERCGSPGRKQPWEAVNKKSVPSGTGFQHVCSRSSAWAAAGLPRAVLPLRTPPSSQGRKGKAHAAPLGALSVQAPNPCLDWWLHADFPVILPNLARPLQTLEAAYLSATCPPTDGFSSTGPQERYLAWRFACLPSPGAGASEHPTDCGGDGSRSEIACIHRVAVSRGGWEVPGMGLSWAGRQGDWALCWVKRTHREERHCPT